MCMARARRRRIESSQKFTGHREHSRINHAVCTRSKAKNVLQDIRSAYIVCRFESELPCCAGWKWHHLARPRTWRRGQSACKLLERYLFLLEKSMLVLTLLQIRYHIGFSENILTLPSICNAGRTVVCGQNSPQTGWVRHLTFRTTQLANRKFSYIHGAAHKIDTIELTSM